MFSILRFILPFCFGCIFALGLGLSGMTEPKKVIGFLDLFGNWDPSLIFVMVGAIAVNTVLYRLLKPTQKRPLLEKKFHWPQAKKIDGKLLQGAALFGVGWGLAGLCPGPAIAALSTGQPYALTFGAALLAGTAIGKLKS